MYFLFPVSCKAYVFLRSTILSLSLILADLAGY